MAIINIPRKQYAVLSKLAELSEPQFAELIKGLNEIGASLSPTDFSKHLSENVKTIPADDLSGLVKMLCGLYPAKENHNKTPAQIGLDVKETAVDEKPQIFPPERAAILETRINKLLSIDKAIAITAKAQDVVTEHPRVFCAARIFSDIRPVFSAEADSVSAAVVVHTLNITYHQEGDHKEFFVTMDNADIDELKKAIERSEKKYKVLQSLIQKSGVTYLKGGE
jgi:hypothetical protein